jgi:hypothetical protein
MSRQPAFRGKEPPEPLDELEVWASFQLASELEAYEAIVLREPLPRERLRPEARDALGLTGAGPDFVLDRAAARQLYERRHMLSENDAGPAGLEVGPELAPLPPVRIVPLDKFADEPEQGEEAILGTPDNAVIPEAGDVMFYGDGGAGKTTLVVDLACHLAAGDPWLGIPVARAARVLLIENEGPRARFRRKLRRKLDAWAGSRLGDRIYVLEAPWAAFSFADERWLSYIAEFCREHEIDVVIVGPVVSAGMETAGTLQDVRRFLALVAEVREGSGRRLVNVLVHHENKGGKVSGAWEGVGDTLVHVQAQEQGQLRLHWQKTRWASDYHNSALQLRWAEGDSFTVEEEPEGLDDEALAEAILNYVAANGGSGWGNVEDATPGANRKRRMQVRDGLLAQRRIVNVRRKRGEPEQALFQIAEASRCRLYVADDPAIAHLLPQPGAVGEQSAPAWGEGADMQLLPAPRPLRGAGGAVAERSSPPPPESGAQEEDIPS